VEGGVADTVAAEATGNAELDLRRETGSTRGTTR